jgi:para-nitrobenzyl esterase
MLGDEDCLYLDVYIPANATGALPVMIWFYGGAYVLGDKFEFGFYEATNIVTAEPHIHVAMNYRLGVFGFMSLPELFAESNTTGNYALQDQRFAMQWVNENAKALGADTKRVTIFGESAGGFSVCWCGAAGVLPCEMPCNWRRV